MTHCILFNLIRDGIIQQIHQKNYCLFVKIDPGGDSIYNEDNNNGIYVEKQIRIPTFTMTYEHTHAYCEIFFLKTGSCIYHVNNNTYHLTAGEAMVVAPGDSHSTSYEGLVPCERIIVYCKPEAIPESFLKKHDSISKNIRRSGKIILDKKGQIKTDGILLRMMEENNMPDEHSFELLGLYVMEMLLCLDRSGIFVCESLRVNDGISTDIADTLTYIAQNYRLPLSLEDVAGQINLSPTYLSKKFRKVTGITFKEYVNYIRIKQAVQALLTTDDSITKIAVDCGFNSSNYFKDIFRKINGVSPRDFRKQSTAPSYEPLDNPVPGEISTSLIPKIIGPVNEQGIKEENI